MLIASPARLTVYPTNEDHTKRDENKGSNQTFSQKIVHKACRAASKSTAAGQQRNHYFDKFGWSKKRNWICLMKTLQFSRLSAPLTDTDNHDRFFEKRKARACSDSQSVECICGSFRSLGNRQ